MAIDPTGDDHIDAFQLADHGVNLTQSLIRRPPGMWTQVQNGQPSFTYGRDGIEKRGGLASFHTVALAGAVMAMGNVPLGSYFDTGITDRLIAGLREDTPLTGAYFISSTDGASWAAYSALTKPSQGWLRTLNREESLLYVSELSGDVAMQRWDGTTRYQVVDAFPQIADGDVFAVCYANGLVYFIVNTASPPAGASVYYVYSFNPASGVVTQLGGTNLTHALIGEPCGIEYCAGALYVISKGASNAAGVIYKLVESGGTGTWTLDNGPAAREYRGGAVATLQTSATVVINGRLYFSLVGNGATIPGKLQYMLNGSYNDYFTCPNNDESVTSVVNHNGVVIHAVANPSNAAVRIYANGVQELDVVGTYGATSCIPGDAVVYSDGSLYWAWFRPGSVLLQGFVLKRTSSGVWSQATTGRALNGMLGMIGVA